MDLIQNIVDSIHNSPVSLCIPLPYGRLLKLQHVSQLLPLGHVDGQDNLLAGGHEAAAAAVAGIVAVDCVIAAAAVARVVGPSAVGHESQSGDAVFVFAEKDLNVNE